jgi:GNAT superfamily N-acetyltransferase
MISYLVDPFPSDAELAQLWLSAWGSPGPPTFTNILSRSLAHVCAYEDGLLVGYVNLAWDGGAHAFVLDTCVHRQWQRRGIGTELVLTAIGVARDRGATWLHVDFEEQLRSFYRGCGFRDSGAGVLALV